MDDNIKFDIVAIEEEVRDYIKFIMFNTNTEGGFKKQPSEDIIEKTYDIIFGYLEGCIKDFPQAKAIKAMKHICLTLFYYIFERINKPTKHELERAKYKELAYRKQLQKLKNELWNPAHFADKDLHLFHRLLDEAIEHPFRFVEPPEYTPIPPTTKQETIDSVSFWLSDRLNARKCIRRVKKILEELDQMLKNDG